VGDDKSGPPCVRRRDRRDLVQIESQWPNSLKRKTKPENLASANTHQSGQPPQA
jgi:hypothetical protein